METTAKFIIVISILVLIVYVLYKVASWVMRLATNAIKRNTIRKNEALIVAEIEKVDKMLAELGTEQMTHEEVRKSGKNYTRIL